MTRFLLPLFALVAAGSTFAQAPPAWTCDVVFYDDSECDCGCGAIDDLDCPVAGGCAEPGCNEQSCQFCFNAAGDEIPCGVPNWTCNVTFYDDGLVCDCGCGDVDPDCFNGSCTEPGCMNGSCDICNDASGNPVDCVPADWLCPDGFFGDSECDCGCGSIDVDCVTGGCAEPGCAQASCTLCWDDAVNEIPCASEGEGEGRCV